MPVLHHIQLYVLQPLRWFICRTHEDVLPCLPKMHSHIAPVHGDFGQRKVLDDSEELPNRWTHFMLPCDQALYQNTRRHFS
jgi:hypothetical protein